MHCNCTAIQEVQVHCKQLQVNVPHDSGLSPKVVPAEVLLSDWTVHSEQSASQDSSYVTLLDAATC